MRLSNKPIARYYPWVVLLLSAAFLIYNYILQVYPSVMIDDLMHTFHLDGAGMGNLAATFFYPYIVTQLFAGVLLDKYSPRTLSSVAIVLAAAGVGLFAISYHLWLAVIARMLIGCGCAFATVSYMKLAAMWFRPRQFAFVGGLLATAAMLGAALGEAPLAFMVNAMSWRVTLVICATLGVFIAVCFWAIVRDRRNPTQNLAARQSSHVSLKDIWEVLSSGQNWLLTFYSGLAFAPVAVFAGLWANAFLMQTHGLVRTQSASLVSVSFLGLALGGPVLGWLSDRLRKRRLIMLIGTFASGLAISGVIYLNGLSIVMMMVLLFIFGFGTGVFMLGFALGKELNKIYMVATVVSLINTGDGIFSAVTDPLVGKFLDLGWQGKMANGIRMYSTADYHRALSILPAYLLVALILLIFIREPQKRQKKSLRNHTKIN